MLCALACPTEMPWCNQRGLKGCSTHEIEDESKGLLQTCGLPG